MASVKLLPIFGFARVRCIEEVVCDLVMVQVDTLKKLSKAGKMAFWSSCGNEGCDKLANASSARRPPA